MSRSHFGVRSHVDSAAFLLAQVGFAAMRRYADRLAPLGLEPRHVGLLHFVAAAEGQSQQELGERMQVPPSRMVSLVDDLERRGLVQRRRNAADRRAYAVHLTTEGRAVLDEVIDVSIDHEASLCAGLDASERRQLIDLLQRIADGQGIPRGVHPGYAGSRARGRGW